MSRDWLVTLFPGDVEQLVLLLAVFYNLEITFSGLITFRLKFLARISDVMNILHLIRRHKRSSYPIISDMKFNHVPQG